MNKAVFLDRDGVINRLVVTEGGRIDTPLTDEQFLLVDSIGKVIRELRQMGFLIIVISNQPNVGKGWVSKEMFERTRRKMLQELDRDSCTVDAEYYCFHSPAAIIPEYRMDCDCRKPRPGLLVKAITEHRIDPKRSVMIGDSLTDIEAGLKAGCKTILLGHMSSLLTTTMKDRGVYPSLIAESVSDLPFMVRKLLD